jgi:hypothetical protein
VRRHDVDHRADRQARGAGIDQHRDDAALAALGPAAEDDVIGGDAGIRDPGFGPSMTIEAPSRRAVVCIAARSDPASASEIAKAAMLVPAATAGK